MIQVNDPDFGLLPINVTRETLAPKPDAVILHSLRTQTNMVKTMDVQPGEISHNYLRLLEWEVSRRGLVD
jgi:hypothetical protein